MKKVVALVITTAVLFATMEVALKTAGTSIDSFQLTFLRFLIGGLILTPPAILESRRSGYRVNLKDIGWLTLVGAMGIPVSMLAFQIAVLHLNAATAAPMICTNALFTMLIAHIFTADKMNRDKWFSFFVGMIAIIFMIRPWDMQEGNTGLGFLIVLFASITFAAYSVMGKRSIGRIGTFTQTSISFIMGSLLLMIVMLFTGHPVFAGAAVAWKSVLYCGVVVTGIGYYTYFLSIKESSATIGAMAFFSKPAIAPVFAILILHETIYWNTVVGIILLIAASTISLRSALLKSRSASYSK